MSASRLPPRAHPARNAPLYVKAQTALYRATGGLIGGRAGKERWLLLTTTGRKSGRRYVAPLSYFRDEQTPYVVASNYGRERQPAWYLNLVANPTVEVEIQRDRQRARAEVANHGTRARIWADLIARAPRYAEYQRRTTREIPIVLLHLES